MRKVNKIVIHCADTPAGMDIGRDEIDSWHKERGWAGIGYHWVIRRDGTVEAGRLITQVGAHVSGHNHDSIGICMVGGKPDFNFTFAQLEALQMLIADMRLVVGNVPILGHRDLDPGKECPTFDVAALFSHS